MTMAVAEVTEAAAVLQGLAAQGWQLIKMDQATTGVCWSFYWIGNPLFAGVI
jgi:hypothetical protein